LALPAETKNEKQNKKTPDWNENLDEMLYDVFFLLLLAFFGRGVSFSAFLDAFLDALLSYRCFLFFSLSVFPSFLMMIIQLLDTLHSTRRRH
jgi:hypothetical protein